jgi:hypothetical protein
MPLTLALDAGSMLQLAVLIVEDSGYTNLYGGLRRLFRLKNNPPSYALCEPIGKENNITLEQSEAILPTEIEPLRRKGDVDIVSKALIAISAVIFFLVIVSLQIVGVYYASKGRQAENLTVTWCSPIFELFTLAVSDGNCNFYPVAQNSRKGLGCIDLPAIRQTNWLLATLAIGSIALIFEFCDFLILMMVHSKTRWRNIKMKRPWFTVSQIICPSTLLE